MPIVTVSALLKAYKIEDLRKAFMEANDPTGAVFADKVLDGNQEFLDSLFTSKVMGPYLKIWQTHVSERLIAEGLTTMKEIKDDPDVSPATRLSAAKSLAAFNKGYSRQEREAVKDYARTKAVNSRNVGDNSSPLTVDTDLDWERLLSKTQVGKAN